MLVTKIGPNSDLKEKITTNVVMMTTRPTLQDIIDLARNGKVKKVIIPKSYMKSLSKTAINFADNMGLELIEAKKDLRGRRADLHGNLMEMDDDHNVLGD